MPQILEKCVTKVMKQGKAKDNAYAICTAALKKAHKMSEPDFDNLPANDIVVLGMDFNTAHDIIHEDARNMSDACPVCQGSVKGDAVQEEAGRIIKRQRQRRVGMNVWGQDQNDKENKLSDRVSDTMVYPLTPIVASEDGKLPNEIHVLPIGEWDTVPYGKIKITAEDCKQMVENYKAGARAGDSLPIDVDHDGKQAAGWMTDLHVRDDGLWAPVDWTDLGTKLLGEKRYKFFSPEFNPEYVDPENKKIQLNNVLIGGGLVNRPLFKELKRLVAGDQLTNTNKGVMLFIETKETMNRKDLETKKTNGETLTAAEEEFLKKAIKADDNGNADDGDADDADAKKKKEDAKTGSEPRSISISAAEYEALKANADRGVEAAEKLEKKEIEDTVSAWLFSENGGHFQPALKDDLTTFYKSLNEDQRKTFSELVEKMPQAKFFGERGSGETLTPGKKADMLTVRAKEIMEESKKSGRNMRFSDAVKKATRETPDLADYKLIPVEERRPRD